MPPKISIIVPCYGVEKYLDRCMESLVNQSLRDIEIIMVDDKSPDKVPAMCDEWARKDTRVRVIHKPENEGLGFARNTGLNIACGDYVAFIDSDDFVNTDMFADLYHEAEGSRAEVVFSNFHVENNKGWHVCREVSKRMEWSGEEVIDFALDMVASKPGVACERRFQMSVWHSIYKRSMIEENNIRFHSEREVNSEDFPFQMDFLLKARKVVFVPQAYYHYCLNSTSLTQTFNVDKFRRIENLYNLLCEKLDGISGAQERLDRFYMGYERHRIQELMMSATQGKSSILRKEIAKPVWKEIRKRYPIKKLPGYPRAFLILMCVGNVTLIKMLFHLVAIAKR